MKSARAAWLPLAAITLVAALAIGLTPAPPAVVLRLWLVGTGGVVALLLGRMIVADQPRLRVEPIAWRRPAPPPAGRPPGLDEVERAVDFGSWNQADFQHRLRPILVEVAEHRLASRRGIDMTRQPERARSVLGEVAWRLLSPEPAGADPRGPGVPPANIRAAIEALEAI